MLCLNIRLAPKYVQRKFDRMPHKHIASHRAEYVGHALTIIQAFLRHGQRDGTLTPIGSYDEWSRFCREPLIWLGEPDPASSLIEQVRDNTDNEALGVFLKVWRDLYGNESMMTREVLADVPRKQKLLEIIHELPVTERDGINSNKLGHYLKDHRGVRVNGLRIEDGVRTERKSWCVLTDDE